MYRTIQFVAQKKKSVRRKVQKIIDGDTFKVRRKVVGSQFIRISNTDCPEKGQRGYKQAKQKLSKLLKGKTVTLRPKGKSYGRTVADVIYKRKKFQGVC